MNFYAIFLLVVRRFIHDIFNGLFRQPRNGDAHIHFSLVTIIYGLKVVYLYVCLQDPLGGTPKLTEKQ